MRLDRRSFLTLAAAASAGAAASTVVQGTAFAEALGLAPNAVFQYGVASGDPLPDRLLLWTRVTPQPGAAPGSGLGGPTRVRWLVATDPRLTQVVRAGAVTATAATDHTVKVDVDGLAPGTTYYYGFAARGQLSAVGRGRTAPAAGSTPSRLRFGLVSCSNYAAGYFGGYRLLAARNDLDFVLHVGDDLYEYGDGQFGATRPLDPSTETVRLADYRRRHALYKADPDLRAAHASATWITTIDDHEVANDTWRDDAQNHDETTEGSFAERRSVALRANLEWMPIRVTPMPGGAVELAVPTRTLLGGSQKQWLQGELAQPTQGELAQPTQWKLLGNSVQLVTVNYPPTGLLGYLGRSGRAHQDASDGYPFDQGAVLGQAAAGPYDLVALTGDVHTTWAASPTTATGVPAGVEFVSTSVTSDNVNELLGQPPRNPTSLHFEGVIQQINAPRIPLVELDLHGASILEITPERVQCDLVLRQRPHRPGRHHRAGLLSAEPARFADGHPGGRDGVRAGPGGGRRPAGPARPGAQAATAQPGALRPAALTTADLR